MQAHVHGLEQNLKDIKAYIAREHECVDQVLLPGTEYQRLTMTTLSSVNLEHSMQGICIMHDRLVHDSVGNCILASSPCYPCQQLE